MSKTLRDLKIPHHSPLLTLGVLQVLHQSFLSKPWLIESVNSTLIKRSMFTWKISQKIDLIWHSHQSRKVSKIILMYSLWLLEKILASKFFPITLLIYLSHPWQLWYWPLLPHHWMITYSSLQIQKISKQREVKNGLKDSTNIGNSLWVHVKLNLRRVAFYLWLW